LRYNVYRATVSGGPYAFFTTAPSTSAFNNGLTPSTTYYYVVTSVVGFASDQQSSNSAEAAATTPVPPPAPTGVTATASSTTGINVSWNAVSGAGSYRLYRSTDGGATYTLLVTTTKTSYPNTGLTPNTTYFYEVGATVPGLGPSPLSTPVSATTLSPPPAPTGVTATAASSSRINVSWNAVSGAGSYRIFRSTDGGATYTLLVTTTKTSYPNTGLTHNTTYFYEVGATVPGLGPSPLSTPVSGTTP
jgi:fibronectin type 3 domain-containing protein